MVIGLTWPVLKPTIYHTWGEHANHYTTDAVSNGRIIFFFGDISVNLKFCLNETEVSN
jgi:hypothetical protein